MEINVLSDRLLKINDSFCKVIFDLSALKPKERTLIYQRWRMLHLMLDGDIEMFEKNLLRINDSSGKDRRYK